MKAAGGEGGIRTPGTGFSPVQQISNLPCSATPAPLRGGGSPVRERLFGGTGLVRLAQGLALVSAMEGRGAARDRKPRRAAAAAGPPPSVDPAGHARHHARRRDRPRGRGVRRRRSTRSRRAAGASARRTRRRRRRCPSHSSMMTGLYPGRPRRPRERALRSATTTRCSRSGCSRPAIAPRRSSRRSCSRGASGSRAASTSTTTSCRQGAPSGAPQRDDRPRARVPRERRASSRCFLWVHYYDPHYPVRAAGAVPRRGTPSEPYLGEVAAMDEQLGRLRRGVRARTPGRRRSSSSADHGEGLGEHGEAQHGNLLYQATMHVPLVLVGPGVSAGRRATRRSARGASSTRCSTGRASTPRTACARRATRGRRSARR